MSAELRNRYGYVEPLPIMEALDLLRRTIGAGWKEAGLDGPWYSPRDGYVEVRWLNRKGTYRFTLDLMPPGSKRDDQV